MCLNPCANFRLASRRALASGFKVLVVVDCRANERADHIAIVRALALCAPSFKIELSLVPIITM